MSELSQTEHEKREALANWVLALPSKAARWDWLSRFEARHGKALADDLKARMTRLYRARKQQQRGGDDAAAR